MRTLLPLLVLTGCKVVDAPESIEELVVFGFMGFDDGDDVASATATGLLPLAAEFDAELTDGLRVNEMTQEQIEEAGVETTLERPIIGLAAKVQLTSSMEDVAAAWSAPNMDEFIEVTTQFEIRDEVGDRDCFLALECNTYSYDGWREVDMGILGTGEQTFNRAFLRTTLEDGTTAIIIRELIPDGTVTNSNIVNISTQFSYAVLYPTDEGTQRVEAFWIEAEAIGIDLPDYFALDMAVNQMNKTAEQVDEYIAE